MALAEKVDFGCAQGSAGVEQAVANVKNPGDECENCGNPSRETDPCGPGKTQSPGDRDRGCVEAR
jgi:hypothetical protein